MAGAYALASQSTHDVAQPVQASTFVYCRAYALASLAPTKDMEVVVIGDSLESAGFQRLLYVALRALIDKLAAATFNVGIFNIRVPGSDNAAPAASPQTSTDDVPVVAR